MKPTYMSTAASLSAFVVPAIFAISNPVLAQDVDTTEVLLDEIVVVAHKRARPISDIAANVTIIDRADLDGSMSASVADMFRYIPGIDYQTAGSRFGGESINIRGIAGNRVAILVDGVPLSDQFDVGSFSNATRDFINAGLIDKVEVLHGPASALYGSSAIGGVVATTTPDPAHYLKQGNVGGDLSSMYRGADSSVNSSGIFAAGEEDRGVLFGASYGTGEQPDSAASGEALDERQFDRWSLLAKGVLVDRFGNGWRLGFLHQDSSVNSSLSSMLGSGRYRSTTALLGDDHYTMSLANLTYDFDDVGGIADGGLIRLYGQHGIAEQDTVDERGLANRPVSIDRYFEFEQEIYGADLNFFKTLSSASVEHGIGYGIEFRQRKTTEYRDGLETDLATGDVTNVLLGEVFPLRDFPISKSKEWGAYLEDVMTVGDWNIIAAVRFDDYSLDPQSDSMFDEDYPFAETVSISESEISPKFGVVYHATDNSEVYLQYAHGFRAPPYADANIGLEIPLFNYRAIPNPDLVSESSDGIDAGWRWRGERGELMLGAFYTQYKDFIESKVRLGTDPVSGRTLFQSQNLRRTTIAGVEANWNLQITDTLAFDGAFYQARGENDDTGEPLNSVGPGQLVSGLIWRPQEQRSLRLQATMAERWSDLDESKGPLFKPPGYAVFDLFYTQQLGERLTMRAGLLNLADRTYWRWSDVRGLSPTDPVIPFLSQPGRSVSFSLTMNWQ